MKTSIVIFFVLILTFVQISSSKKLLTKLRKQSDCNTNILSFFNIPGQNYGCLINSEGYYMTCQTNSPRSITFNTDHCQGWEWWNLVPYDLKNSLYYIKSVAFNTYLSFRPNGLMDCDAGVSLPVPQISIFQIIVLDERIIISKPGYGFMSTDLPNNTYQIRATAAVGPMEIFYTPFFQYQPTALSTNFPTAKYSGICNYSTNYCSFKFNGSKAYMNINFTTATSAVTWYVYPFDQQYIAFYNQNHYSVVGSSATQFKFFISGGYYHRFCLFQIIDIDSTTFALKAYNKNLYLAYSGTTLVLSATLSANAIFINK